MTQSNFIRLLKISRHISFKTIKKADFENATDNQGGGPIGYYRLDINKKPVGLTINIKYNFLPEKTTIKSIKLYQ